jgi:hypothetical protein
MHVKSEWVFDCEPQYIWPHFLSATMDNSRPLMFRVGVPKPVSCRILDDTIAVGGTRQCTTERGTSDQQILEFTENKRLHYRMINSSMPLSHWIESLEDTFTLTSLPDGKTRVGRSTQFSANGAFKLLKSIGIAVFLRQTHSYAARNWRRLSYAKAAAEQGRVAPRAMLHMV